MNYSAIEFYIFEMNYISLFSARAIACRTSMARDRVKYRDVCFVEQFVLLLARRLMLEAVSLEFRCEP
jgi:hypothetical protein